MLSLNDKLINYAKLIVNNGINLQNGQTLYINSTMECEDFTSIVVEEAYKIGAKYVHVNWISNKCNRARYQYSKKEYLEEYPKFLVDCINGADEINAAYLSITVPNPDALKGIDSERISIESKASNLALKNHSKYILNSVLSWCVVNVPSPTWASKVFPNLPIDEALDKLYDIVLSAVRADNDNVVESWKNHTKTLFERTTKLNNLHIKTMHYKSPTIDLSVDLPEGAIWQGGSEKNANGIEFIANIPTEEIFTSPNKDDVEGIVFSSLPLSYGGNIVDEFYLRFKDGQVIDFGAKEGYEVLKGIIDSAEGSKRLGEIALIPYHSPINELKTLFYNTLYDENASCHMALGIGFSECIKGGIDMDKKELFEKGVNDSLVHVDFMMGTEDLMIDGILEDGSHVKIFENGNFVF